jgi:hypothetical protein
VNEAWYIDALDTRAGLAFASYRVADLTSETVTVDLPCIFIEPPAFRPESLSSRAPAFAASRGSFQLGLFVQEQEVAFPTLEDVVEFVRRAFLRGGGGDGPGGLGPGVPVPPEVGPERGSLEGLPRPEGLGGDAEADVIASLLAEVRRDWLDKDSDGNQPANTQFTAGKPIVTHVVQAKFHASATSDQASAQALAWAAAELIRELVRRFPFGGDDSRLFDWFSRSSRLGHLIIRLGLRPSVYYFGFFAHLSDWLWRGMKPQQQEQASRLFDARPHTDDRDLAARLFGFSHRWYGYRDAWAQAADPLDDLASWPIPTDVAQLTGAARVDRASLHDLLNAVIGSPQVLDIGQSEPAAQRAAALVLLASVHIVSLSAPGPTFVWDGEINRMQLGRSARLGSEWLAQQFPRRAFPAVIEELIAGASRLAYA